MMVLCHHVIDMRKNGYIFFIFFMNACCSIAAALLFRWVGVLGVNVSPNPAAGVDPSEAMTSDVEEAFLTSEDTPVSVEGTPPSVDVPDEEAAVVSVAVAAVTASLDPAVVTLVVVEVTVEDDVVEVDGTVEGVVVLAEAGATASY